MRITVVTPTIRPDGLDVVKNSLKRQLFTSFEWLTSVNVTGKVDFNKAMNEMISRARGELIVSVQDYIEIPYFGLQKFWEEYDGNKKQVFTAPVGKTLDWKTTKWDWRRDRRGKCDWQEWEIDYASAPRQALIDVGGFDEELDNYWGFDNVNIGLRLHMAGYEVVNLYDNPATAFDHDHDTAHPFRKLRNPEFHNEQLDKIRRGDWQKSCSYF